MAVLRSRLLVRLDASIAKTRNPVDLACLKAEKAAFLARQGRMELARRIVDEIQAQFAWRPHAAVSAWLSLVEGLIEYYGELGLSAHDRVRRAYALSGAAHLAPLHALCAAWLSVLDFAKHDMSDLASHVGEALRTAAPDHHAARSRASLTVAIAYHYADRIDAAKPWYEACHRHAIADGDEPTVSALMYNRATLHAAASRLASAFGTYGEAERQATREAQLGADSTGHFELGIGGASLGFMVPMLRAQVALCEGRVADALPLLEQHFDASMEHGFERMRSAYLADLLWCRLAMGQEGAVRQQLPDALDTLGRPSEIDDRAVAQARFAQVLDRLGDQALAATLRQRAERDLAVHRTEQARMASLLDDALAGLAPV